MFRYVVEAVTLVAEEGWRLMPDYRFDTTTGRWHHRDGAVEPPLRLTDVSYPDGVMTYPRTHVHGRRVDPRAASGGRQNAFRLRIDTPEGTDGGLSADLEGLRWFDLPTVCLS